MNTIRRFLLAVAVCAAIGIMGAAVHAQSYELPLSATPIWIPLIEPRAIGVFWQQDPNNPLHDVWGGMYAKQYDQTQFKVCGRFVSGGDGFNSVMLTYADIGDQYEITSDGSQCFTTYVGYGGGSTAQRMHVYLTGPVVMYDPMVYVGQER